LISIHYILAANSIRRKNKKRPDMNYILLVLWLISLIIFLLLPICTNEERRRKLIKLLTGQWSQEEQSQQQRYVNVTFLACVCNQGPAADIYSLKMQIFSVHLLIMLVALEANIITFSRGRRKTIFEHPFSRRDLATLPK
jgi:hypothetical protein